MCADFCAAVCCNLRASLTAVLVAAVARVPRCTCTDVLSCWPATIILKSHLSTPPRFDTPCSAPGERLQAKLGGGDKSGLSEGVTGLRNGPARTGVRELTYRLVFIASGTQVGGSAGLGMCCAWHTLLPLCMRVGCAA